MALQHRPVKAQSRVFFAARCDVFVPGDMGNGILRYQGATQRCQRFVLRRLKDIAFQPFEFDANRVVIAVAAAPVAGLPSMPGTRIAADNLQDYLDAQERDILSRVLHDTRYNRTAAASKLGMSLRQIRYRIARLNIAMPDGDTQADNSDGADDAS